MSESQVKHDFDLQKYKSEMSKAREAGITFEAIRDIMNAHADDGPDGDSFGRMVERIRELAIDAAERMSASRSLHAELRRLRDVLQWTNDQCPGRCSAVCDDALRTSETQTEPA